MRGRDTRLGEAGWCEACDQWVAEGPDACIGLKPGVREACCGHGNPSLAYVSYPDGQVLYGTAARAALGLPTFQ